MKNISIAVDGPAGAGKSTIAKTVAKKLGLVYIDTGAMYRSVALYAKQRGVDTKNDKDGVCAVLDGVEIELKQENGAQKVYLCGEDVSERIRMADISMGASDVAVIPEVRIKLVELQRAMAEKSSVIMDGRDIGTYVLPDADLKIFLTASVDARAKRRYDELVEKGVECDFDSVREDMKARDKNDSEREFAPLRQAEDAVLIDTTGKTLDESIEMVYNVVNDVIQTSEE